MYLMLLSYVSNFAFEICIWPVFFKQNQKQNENENHNQNQCNKLI